MKEIGRTDRAFFTFALNLQGLVLFEAVWDVQWATTSLTLASPAMGGLNISFVGSSLGFAFEGHLGPTVRMIQHAALQYTRVLESVVH